MSKFVGVGIGWPQRRSSVLPIPTLPSPYAYYFPGPTTLFKDMLKTQPCANGEAAWVLADSSGNGRDAWQATPAYRPTASLVGGVWSIQGDGVDDFMATMAVTLNQPATWGVRYKSLGTGDGSEAASSLMGGRADNMLVRVASTPTNIQFLSPTLLPTEVPISYSSYETLVVTWNGASSEVRRNGVVVATGDPGTAGATFICLLGWIESVPIRIYKGRLAGVMINNAILTTPEKVKMETYLAYRAP